MKVDFKKLEQFESMMRTRIRNLETKEVIGKATEADKEDINRANNCLYLCQYTQLHASENHGEISDEAITVPIDLADKAIELFCLEVFEKEILTIIPQTFTTEKICIFKN